MILKFTFLCVIAARVSGTWEPNLRVRFDVNPFAIGTSSFMEMPKTNETALKEGWIKVNRPAGPTGLQSLAMWCPSDDYTVCTLYDNCGHVAGLQVALDQTKFTSPFDMTVQGFTNWTTVCNSVTTTYYTIQMYFVSADTLASEESICMDKRDSTKLLQEKYVWLTGYNGQLFNVSTDTSAWSDFTQQPCFVGMGHHYYYKMSSSIECAADTLFPWFLLKYSDQIVGVGFGVFGKLTVTGKQYNEFPSQAAVKNNVPGGPACYHEMAGDPGVITMHIYFIDKPYLISCIIE